ncbi:sulfurtransferase [Pseudomaricurvus sp.]|uniref:sulfurtransferase n=1 Tax=Pseudomaricurvus sp. TaxID=2004510 RepID=UPI003F6D1919
MSSDIAESVMSKTIITVNSVEAELATSVILDCRFSLSDPAEGERLYHQDHLPGAQYCHLEQHLSGTPSTHGGRHPLPSSEAFSEQLQLWGIRESTPVIVYDDQRFAFAARAWWLLKAVGIRNVRLLDGGYSAWKNHHKPFDRRTPPLHPTQHTQALTLSTDHLVDYSKVKTLSDQQEVVLVDSREAHRYNGDVEPIDPIAGHIPGAINKPWQEITDEAGYIKPLEFHLRRWLDLPESQQVIVYCGSGVTACVNLLSAHLAGKTPDLYPGSWSDWCSYQLA